MKKRTKVSKNPFLSRALFQIPNLNKKVRDLREANSIKNKKIKELEEQNERKKIILTVIAHDLTTPFHALLGMTELLMEGAMPEDQETKCIRSMHKQTKNTFILLTDLLNWSRTQTNGNCQPATIVNLEEVTHNTVESLKPLAFKKGIKLTSKIPLEIMAFTCPDIIKIVIRNLISNAIKFTEANGKIILTAVDDGEEKFVKISVTDTGVGIKPENLDKLFSPSFKTIGTDNEKGSGLGLMFCKDFIEKQGGTLSVESKIGEGTTFSFTIPVAPATENTK